MVLSKNEIANPIIERQHIDLSRPILFPRTGDYLLPVDSVSMVGDTVLGVIQQHRQLTDDRE
jgi:hypothetical protein